MPETWINPADPVDTVVFPLAKLQFAGLAFLEGEATGAIAGSPIATQEIVMRRLLGTARDHVQSLDTGEPVPRIPGALAALAKTQDPGSRYPTLERRALMASAIVA